MRESNAEVKAFNRYSYDGFVDDAKNTLDFCLQIEKDFKINDIKNELEQLASVAKEEESAGIASLIDSINNMQKFMESVKKSMHKRDSGINRLIGNKYGDDEEAYKKDIQDNLKVFTSNARLFFGKKSLGNGVDMSKPLRMRQPLDDFNRKTDCSYYDDHEELIQKIEGLFDKFSALQFLVIRITSLQESFDSDKKINEIINAQRDNRVKFDGIMSKNPGIKTPADVEKQKADLEKKHGTLEKAYNSMEKNFRKQQTDYNTSVQKLSGLEGKKGEYAKNKKAAEDKISDCEKRMEPVQKEADELTAQMEAIKKKAEKAQKTKSENEEKAANLNGSISEKEKLINECKSVLSMKVSGLGDFKDKMSEAVTTSSELLNVSFKQSLDSICENLNKASADILIRTSKLDGPVSRDKTGVNKKIVQKAQYDDFVRGFDELMAVVNSLPAELSVDVSQYTLVGLKELFQKDYEKVPKYASLFSLTQILGMICPEGYSDKKLSEIDTVTIALKSSEISESINSDVMMLARNAADLQVEIFDINQKIRKGGLSKAELKELNNKLKDKTRELEKIHKDKRYVKGSDEVILVNQDIGIFLQDERLARKEFDDLEKKAMVIADGHKAHRDSEAEKLKSAITGSMADIIAKLPGEYEELKGELSRIADSIKDTLSVEDVQKAISDFEKAMTTRAANDEKELDGLKKELSDVNEVIKNMDEEISRANAEEKDKEKALADANNRLSAIKAESDAAKKDLKKWDYDSEYAGLKAISDEEKRKLDLVSDELKQSKQDLDENKADLNNIKDISKSFDDMYKTEEKRYEFESDQDAIDRAKVLFSGELFMDQMRSTFISFYENKDIQKKSSANSGEYSRMESGLKAFLDMDPKKITAGEYVAALNELQRSAQQYIDAKKRQWFRWIPSRLRKFRLQFAKSIVDACENQKNAIAPEDFANVDKKTGDYLKGLNADNAKVVSKEQYLSDMIKKKEANAAPQMDNIINTHVVQEKVQNISPQFDVNKDKEKLINS